MAKKVLCKHSTHLCILADAKYYMPIKLMSTTGNPRDFTVRGTLQKNHIKLCKHSIWNPLEINWSKLSLKWGNSEIVLSSVVMVPLIDKYRVWSIIENNTPLFYIMLLTGVTWKAPNKPNALPIQDTNRSVQHASYSFRMSSSNVTNVTDILINF